jgi:hypothetical protein
LAARNWEARAADTYFFPLASLEQCEPLFRNFMHCSNLHLAFVKFYQLLGCATRLSDYAIKNHSLAACDELTAAKSHSVFYLRRPVIVGARPVRPQALGPDEDGTAKADAPAAIDHNSKSTDASSSKPAYVGPNPRGSSTDAIASRTEHDGHCGMGTIVAEVFRIAGSGSLKMGTASRYFIENAARYLLSALETREFVDYSTFYDGTEATEERLRRAVEPDPEEDSQSPELMMDLAVGQLIEQGIVERNDLESELSDGEKDYRIAWTEGGREKARKGPLVFYDVDM